MNKLFVIGLPRTGTTSISMSMLNYGYRVAHTAYTKHAIESADVISDAPCFSDFKQLDQLFPASKFVYLERNIDLWIPSIKRLLHKMRSNLHPKIGRFNPVLKRSFHEVFGVLSETVIEKDGFLEECYCSHRQRVLDYFGDRQSLLQIEIGHRDSLTSLLEFLNIQDSRYSEFPVVNVGKQVDAWKQYRHVNKVNSYSAGKEHRQFYDYSQLNK